MNFEEWYNGDNDVQDYGESNKGWDACKQEALKIINNTPLGYITESEHEKLEKFADLLEEKINNL